jgi:hypothetical protein
MKVLKQKAHASVTCPDGTYPGVLSGYECKWRVPGGAVEYVHRREFGIRGTVQVNVTVADGVVTCADQQGRNV